MTRKPKLRGKRRIAPRLASGGSRDEASIRLPPEIKAGLMMRAYTNSQSMSWFLEQALIDAFGFRKPEYVQPKQKTAEEKAEARGTRRRA